MARYWPSSFFVIVSQKRMRIKNYSAIVTELAWSIKEYYYCKTKDNFFLVGPMEIVKGQERPNLAHSGSQ